MESDIIEELEALQSIYSPDEVDVALATGDRPATVTLKVDKQPVVTFLLPSTYPNELPEIIPSEDSKLPGLRDHLQTEIGSQIGSSFLFALVESAREWIVNQMLTTNAHKSEEASTATVQHTATNKKAEVCRFFLQKKCKFGDKCHNLHPGSRANAQTPQPTSASKSKQATNAPSECASQAYSEDTKEKGSQEEGQTGKKAPLRQAADVISRILWDPDLQTEDFSVGYLDRFTGIIEKPFMAFSWEDLATVGHNVLAVPKHRIQYFKYRDVIIWDKRSQLDNVFGSRGGKVITDIVPAPTKPAASIDGNEQQASDKQKPIAELKLIEEEDAPSTKVKYSDKDRPTHFVCIKVDNSQVLEKVGQILQHICSCAPDLAVGSLSLGALHVTLCMLRIDSESQSLAAQDVLRNLQRSFVQVLPPSTKLEFTGVGNFHGRLLYAKVAVHHGLSKLVSVLLECFQKAGIRTPGNFAEYTPHMTLLKLSRPMQREAHTATIVPALYSKFTDMHLGTQEINTLHLCSTSGPKVDGFYETLMTLPCSLVCLPPSFLSVVSERVDRLVDEEVFTSAQKEALANGNFEHTIKQLEQLNSEGVTLNHSTHVIVLRGVPGSGKSYLASHCTEHLEHPSQVAVCSADDFFTADSKYAFSTSQLHRAHLHCFDQCLNAISEHKKVIVIDNTNSQLWEYQIYIYICNLLAIPFSILEVPCLDVRMLEMYRSRCVHKLDHSASLSMYERWQKDVRAMIVPPTLSHPGLRKEENRSFSILSLCHPTTDILDSTEPVLARYTAVFLTRESQWLLMNIFPPNHSDIIADHVTLSFEPSLKSLLHTKIGKRVKVKVVSAVDDKDIQAAVVVLPRGLSSENQTPHITLSKKSHASAKDANKLLDSRRYVPMKEKGLILEGVIGVAVRKVEQADVSIILSNVDYHKLLPRMTVSTEEDSSQGMLSPDKVCICTGVHKVTQLFVFDFDLTLFNTTDPKDGREIYESATGKKWPHRGWLGQPDSLMPPLCVYPGPALAEYHDHQGRAGSLTVILTARIERTRAAVERILEEAQVYPDAIYFKPDSSSDTETSPQYKSRIIEKLIVDNEDVTLVKFWDDKADNLRPVKDIAVKNRNVRIEVINASTMPSKKQDTALSTDLVLRGCHLSALYNCAAAVGVDFLSSQHCKMIGYKGNPKDVCHVFGSFPIGRRSDIDMCCLLQSPASPFDHIDSFAKHLEECGILYVHKGMSSRCPRLKVKLEFDCAPSVSYDLIFAVVDNDLTTPALSSRGEILSSLRPCDPRSKVALTGPNFLQQVIEAINGKMSVGEFGMVVEMVVQILRAFRQKSNAYHCIRTFHVVRLLMEFARSPKFSLPSNSNCDDIFRNFMSSVSEIPSVKWQKLFGDFVPVEYIPRIINVFVTVSKQLLQLPADKPLPTQVFYTDFNARPPFPPAGYSTISLCLHGSSKPLLWKLASLLEARLQSCIRKLLDAGIDVVSDGNNSYAKFCFAVPRADVGKDSFQASLKHLTDELSEHEQESLAYLKVHIHSD